MNEVLEWRDSGVSVLQWYFCVIFGVWFERSTAYKKSKRTSKLQGQTLFQILFAYFCQMSSKSILIIWSYTVSKLVHFF